MNTHVLAVGLALIGLPLAGASGGKDIFGAAEGNSVEVRAIDVSADGSGHRPRNGDGSAASVEFRRMPASLCHTAEVLGGVGRVGSCGAGEVEGQYAVVCGVGQVALDPVFRQTWVNNADGSISGLSGWELVNAGDCVGAVDLVPLAEAEFQRLTIAPSPITVQPPDGWTLVNVETITYTDSTVQRFSASLLGIAVTIEASPQSFVWDYGDGSAPLTTADPGRAYPDQSVAHVYRREAVATITLDTTWTGRFQITGATTWTPITGTARTTSTAPPLTVHEARSRLVTDPLD